MVDTPKLIVSPGPHLRGERTTAQIMWWVSGSLLPAYGWAIYIYGVRVVLLVASGILGALVGEWVVCLLQGLASLTPQNLRFCCAQRQSRCLPPQQAKPVGSPPQRRCAAGFFLLLRQRGTLSDGSAVLTGLLLVGTVSPGLPFWMPAAGGFFAIVFGKMLFGGLGFNIFNPALIGRAFLMVTFPVAMTTTWLVPHPGRLLPPDVVTQATPLHLWKLEGVIRTGWTELLLGLHAGSVGEVSVVLVGCGACVLLAKGIIKPVIPLAVIAGLLLVAIWSRVPLFHLLTGGLWFGAFYMATDYVTAPLLPRAQVIFGLGIGILTGVIRLWGGYPEGICYAILIMNSVTPALNHWFRPARPTFQGVPS